MFSRRSALKRLAQAAAVPAVTVVALHTGAVAGPSRQVTFSRDIAPLVYQRCSPCHRPGESGPFPLLSYEDVRSHARQIADVTRKRYMPPWLPEPGFGDFEGDSHLTSSQIALFTTWVEQNCPQGDAAEMPTRPSLTEGWQLGPPDLVLKAGKPLTVPASGPNLFWNFVFSPNVTSRRYVRAIEIRPGNKRLFHHANVVLDRTHLARTREIAAGAGFPGMDLTLERSPLDPDSHFLFWKPGSRPYEEPDGLAWRLAPGTDLVLNVHLQPSGKPESVQPEIGLYFTDKPQTKFPILIQLEHDGALRIPAGDSDFQISDDFRLPVDVDLLAVYPHAHYLGKRLDAYATLPDGTRRWLVRIPDWDLNWQAVYRYREPLFLPKDSVISMRYHYDNSTANPRNPNVPPRLVEAGDAASDEMGHLWLQVLPRGPRGLRLLLEQALMEHRLDKYPGDFRAQMELGALHLAKLDAQAAVTYLRAAVQSDPKQAGARNTLGQALEATGRYAEAAEQFRTALALRPGFDDAKYNLGNALIHLGEWTEAIRNLKEVAEAYPHDRVVTNKLVSAMAGRARELSNEGNAQGAAVLYDELLRLEPDNAVFQAERKALSDQIAK